MYDLIIIGGGPAGHGRPHVRGQPRNRRHRFYTGKEGAVIGIQRMRHLRRLHQEPGGEEQLLKVDGVFVFQSGSKPGTGFLQEQVPLDADGFMLLDEYMQSPVPGVVGAGELRRSPVKQAAVAAADGVIAAMAVDKFIRKRQHVGPQYK